MLIQRGVDIVAQLVVNVVGMLVVLTLLLLSPHPLILLLREEPPRGSGGDIHGVG